MIIRIRGEAEQELEEAVRYLDRTSDQAGDRLLAAFRAAISDRNATRSPIE